MEINQTFFFKTGAYCFLIIGLLSIGNFFYTFKLHNVFTGVSSWVSIFFNFVLSGFFFYLLRQSSPQITEQYASEEVEDLMRQVKDGTLNK